MNNGRGLAVSHGCTVQLKLSSEGEEKVSRSKVENDEKGEIKVKEFNANVCQILKRTESMSGQETRKE